MTSRRHLDLLAWLRTQLAPRAPAVPTDLQRARKLIAAIDAGGLPLNAARINAIARSLGLEVSKHARPEQTIERIRAALGRCASGDTRA